MNSISRSISEQLSALGAPTLPLVGRPGLRIFFLCVGLFATALGIIVLKDVNRRLYNQYQSLKISHEKQYETWGALSLEQSTLSTPSRVEKIASDRLNMQRVNPKNMGVVEIY